jgi:hypothetical protein
MSNAVTKMAVVNQQSEEVTLKAEIEALRAKLKQVKSSNPKVTCQVKTTSKGAVGFVINGLGIPKFFYKQHALMLFGDSEESIKLRAELVEWINAQANLTEKQ